MKWTTPKRVRICPKYSAFYVQENKNTTNKQSFLSFQITTNATIQSSIVMAYVLINHMATNVVALAGSSWIRMAECVMVSQFIVDWFMCRR